MATTDKKRAGMIPYHVTPDGVVEFFFMVPMNPKFGGVKPQIAKGWMEEGETTIKCAMREAKEELGIKKKHMKRVPIYLGLWDNTEIYVVEVKDKTRSKKIDKEEVRRVLWLTKEEFKKQGRRSNRAVVELAYLIAKRINESEGW